MKNNGDFFAIDFFVAMILFFSCVLLIFSHLNQTIETVSSIQSETELALNGIFLTDSILKNRNEEFPLLGSAYYNPELKRIEQNVIDLHLLKKANKNQIFEGFFLKGVQVEFHDFSKELLFENKSEFEKTCMGFERFVLIRNHLIEKKGKIMVVVCNEN